MAEYTVIAANQKKELDGQHGRMQVIALTLGKDGQADAIQAEWFTKATTPLPQQGQKLEGEVEQGQYGLKFKKAQTGFGGGKGGMDPATQRRVARFAAQERALLYMQVKGITDFKLDDDFRKVVTWFQKDAEAAEKA